jgi:hypothetical protein
MPLPDSDKVFHRHADVAADFSQQWRRDVPTRVNQHGRHSPVGVTELLVRAALADFDESEFEEPVDNLARF